MTPPAYHLLDPRPVAAAAPYTFFLPSPVEVAAVAAGDLVRLGFEYPHETAQWTKERMWVMVDQIDGGSLLGRLDNQPDEPTSPLALGELIRFERRHILDIERAEPETAPSPVPSRTYWERCLIDDCVLDRSEPVEFLYREEPDLAADEDQHPDSGWRIRGRFGDVTEEELAERAMSYVAIGAVLNRDDSWLPLIDASVGSAFTRDFATDTYHAEA